jgi:hypothetical protein
VQGHQISGGGGGGGSRENPAPQGKLKSNGAYYRCFDISIIIFSYSKEISMNSSFLVFLISNYFTNLHFENLSRLSTKILKRKQQM